MEKDVIHLAPPQPHSEEHQNIEESRVFRTRRNSFLWQQIPRICDPKFLSMAYRYESLADPDDDIRVALLLPGAFNDDICISFRKRQLEVSQIS